MIIVVIAVLDIMIVMRGGRSPARGVGRGRSPLVIAVVLVVVVVVVVVVDCYCCHY